MALVPIIANFSMAYSIRYWFSLYHLKRWNGPFELGRKGKGSPLILNESHRKMVQVVVSDHFCDRINRIMKMEKKMKRIIIGVLLGSFWWGENQCFSTILSYFQIDCYDWARFLLQSKPFNLLKSQTNMTILLLIQTSWSSKSMSCWLDVLIFQHMTMQRTLRVVLDIFKRTSDIYRWGTAQILGGQSVFVTWWISRFSLLPMMMCGLFLDQARYGRAWSEFGRHRAREWWSRCTSDFEANQALCGCHHSEGVTNTVAIDLITTKIEKILVESWRIR